MGKKASPARRARPRERFDLDNFDPIRIGDPEEPAEEPEEIHAFSIGDNDYYVPTAVPFHHSVRTMDIYAQRGEAAAVTYTLRTVLGNDGYEALMAHEGLQEEEFEAIVRLANQIVNAGQGKARSPKPGVESPG